MSRKLAMILFIACVSQAGRLLDEKEVNILVTNIPEALKVKSASGCPTPDYSELGTDLAMVQLRNTCPRSGTGLIGNYVVDRHTGRICKDLDGTMEVDSPHLQRIRKMLLSNKK